MYVRKATLNDVNDIINLIKERMKWMDNKNLYQWNKTGYLDAYTHDYFCEKIKDESFFVAIEDNQLIGAIALFENDHRWNDKASALYIHHLVSDPNYPGVGKYLISFSEEYAKQNEVKFLRLDSQKGNEKLSDFYQSLGFLIVGEIVEGPYEGKKREKCII